VSGVAVDGAAVSGPVKTLRTNPELDYTLREKLGEGSYGSVWEAQHKRTKAIIAMKVRCFRKSSRLLGSLNHAFHLIGNSLSPSSSSSSSLSSARSH
jgi:serine/threonine protein kinase